MLIPLGLIWVVAIISAIFLDFRGALVPCMAAGFISFMMILMWFTIPPKDPKDGIVNRTRVAEDEARAIWLEGYRRACADFAGAPFTFGVVMDAKMEEHFQKWYIGAEDY